MREATRRFEQQAGLLVLMHQRQLQKRLVVVLHRGGVARRILQDELAILRIAAGFVAFETGARGYLRPDLVREVVVGHLASWAVVSGLGFDRFGPRSQRARE